MKTIITEIEWFSVDDVLPPYGIKVKVKDRKDRYKCEISQDPYWVRRGGHIWISDKGVGYSTQKYKLWAFWPEEDDD